LNILVYYPVEKEKQQELQRRIAAVHSSAIAKYIERIRCPTEQKKEIVARLLRERQKKGTA